MPKKVRYEKGRCWPCSGTGKIHQSVTGSCPDCHGTKRYTFPKPKKVKCSKCKGTGKKGMDHGYPVSCKACGGTGKRKVYIKTRCRRCDATGVVEYKAKKRPKVVCSDCSGTGRSDGAPLVNLGEILEAANANVV